MIQILKEKKKTKLEKQFARHNRRETVTMSQAVEVFPAVLF